ncbi:response regulator transcription factor [uncultured Clostridium sp.]|uniref:response regulator transcription factor n=1 Tax=uncultured Clostridium sp. TaxID=59620 RepID=UPI0025EB6AB1|nr:response regulator transcription factor [uncultured Clostridium sp.]
MSLIYIVEDDENIREIETFALKNSGYTVASFESAKNFYKKISEKVPDLVMLDIMLPDEDGLEIIRKLRNMQSTKKVPIIMVTAKGTEIDKVKALDIGCDDYMTKPFGVMELISRVKALIRRSSDINKEEYIHLGDIFIDDKKRSVYEKNKLCEFTFKEYELLKLLISNVGTVMTREVIMQKVWGTDFEGESRTIDMHIKTIRKKLGESGTRIKTIRNVGYIIE